MTEAQIERRAERMMDELDRTYLSQNYNMTAAEYNRRVKAINDWCEQQYRVAHLRFV